MDPDSGLIELFKRICQRMNEAGMCYCVAGGFAVSLWGTPRGTEDIDLVVVMEENARPVFSDFLGRNFKLIQSHQDLMEFRHVCIWRHIVGLEGTENIFQLDVILINDPYLRKVIKRKINVEYQGLVVPVISIEDLIILKLISLRAIDKFDIENLLKSENPIDWNYLKKNADLLHLDWVFINILKL